jgi:hypothetical protein
MAKERILFDQDQGEYRLETINSKGEVNRSESFHVIAAMDQTEVVNVFLGLVKDMPKKRTAAVNLLGNILRFDLGNGNTLSNWKGVCERDKLLPKGFKDAFLDAEKAYFDQWMSDKHHEHKVFIGRLPKVDVQGNELTVNGKLNLAEQYAYFLRTLRKEPSYSNAKNMVLSFFGYLGLTPFNQDNTLVPPEIMRAYVNEVRIIPAPDRSFRARLDELLKEITSGENNPPDADLPHILSSATDLFACIKGLADSAAQRATAKAKPGDVVDQTKQAMEKANKKLEATPPGNGAGKAEEKTSA